MYTLINIPVHHNAIKQNHKIKVLGKKKASRVSVI